MKIFLLWIQLLSLLLILPACTTSSRLPTTTSINPVIDIPINHGLFDITDINNVLLLDRIDTPSIAGEAELSGSKLYVADGRGSGLQIYDIAAYSYLYSN